MTASGACRRPARWRRLLPLALVCVLFALTGCVTSKKYRLAKPSTPPPKELGWQASAAPVELTLQSLIVFKGPGSWKREARWDEYVVQLSNRGDQPVTITSAALIDVQGNPQFPGNDPWALEKLSRTNWDRYGKTGLKLLAGAGALVVYGTAVEAVAGAGLMGGASAGGAVAVLNIVPVVALVDITAVAVMNHSNKDKVQKEFARRRLVLPRTLNPGETVAGSFFFPMTPGPQRLTLKIRSGEEPSELTLELKPLADLHLKPAAKH
jgi:hypothetical protein